MTFRAGKRHGDAAIWNQGKVQAGMRWEGDLEEGLFETFDESKRPAVRATFRGGLQHGETVHLDAAGRIVTRLPYQDGKVEGRRLDYYDNGRVREESNWKNDQLDGEPLRYDREGRLRERLAFRAGVQVGEPAAYDERGRLRGEPERRLHCGEIAGERGATKKSEVGEVGEAVEEERAAMIYNFQLHRITLILIVALLGVGGGLLFFSGLLVGVSWQVPRLAAAGTLAAAPGDRPARPTGPTWAAPRSSCRPASRGARCSGRDGARR